MMQGSLDKQGQKHLQLAFYYSRKKNIIGLFRYLQWVHENGLWNKVGESYMIIGNDDDPQSHDLNLPTSLVVYNPNPVPIRIKYMIFS